MKLKRCVSNLFVLIPLSIVWRDTKTPAEGLGHAVELVMSENVDIIFGSPSSYGKVCTI